MHLVRTPIDMDFISKSSLLNIFLILYGILSLELFASTIDTMTNFFTLIFLTMLFVSKVEKYDNPEYWSRAASILQISTTISCIELLVAPEMFYYYHFFSIAIGAILATLVFASKHVNNISILVKIVAAIETFCFVYLVSAKSITGTLITTYFVILAGSSFILSFLLALFNENLDKIDSHELRYQGVNLMKFWIYVGVISVSHFVGARIISIYKPVYVGFVIIYLSLALVITSGIMEVEEEKYRMYLSYFILFPSSLLLYYVIPSLIFLFLPLGIVLFMWRRSVTIVYYNYIDIMYILSYFLIFGLTLF